MKISIIGCGNVAHHLMKALYGHVVGCYGRHEESPEGLEDLYYNKMGLLPQSDIYIVAVSDDAIADVTEQLSHYISPEALVLHTSGTKSIDTINSAIKHRGVLYPLQTFNTEVSLNMKEVPFFIEWIQKEDRLPIEQLVSKIGKDATYADSERRKKIHIAAVFACNFTNHLFSIAQQLLKTDKLEFSILEPLVKECVRKAFTADDISQLQTGPAIRHDYCTIKSHIDMLLEYDKEVEKIYEDITNSILNN